VGRKARRPKKAKGFKRPKEARPKEVRGERADNYQRMAGAGYAKKTQLSFKR